MILREIIDSIKKIALSIFISVIFMKYIGQTAMVNGISMKNYLIDGEILWIEKVTPLLNILKRGDIVAIYAPSQVKDEGHSLIKRIVAIPGDYLEIKNQRVYINGAALDQPYTYGDNTYSPDVKFNKITIPTGYYYVLGDNRTDSIHDSRNAGLVAKEDIQGRAVFRLYPLDRIKVMVD